MEEIEGDEVKVEPPSASAPVVGPYAVGMEVAPPGWTPPEVRPDVEPSTPYRGLRFSRRVRWIVTVVLLVPVLALALVGGAQMVLGVERSRAAGLLLWMPLVAGVPLAWWALRDVWGTHR